MKNILLAAFVCIAMVVAPMGAMAMEFVDWQKMTTIEKSLYIEGYLSGFIFGQAAGIARTTYIYTDDAGAALTSFELIYDEVIAELQEKLKIWRPDRIAAIIDMHYTHDSNKGKSVDYLIWQTIK